MIRTILVDDEIHSQRVLTRLLQKSCPEVDIVGSAHGVEEAAHLIRLAVPDLVFLDIEMTQGNAFDLLNQLQPVNFKVIFVTAFEDYAIRAFRFSAVDYLLKPVNIDELRTAVDKVLIRAEDIDLAGQMQVLAQNLQSFRKSQQKMAVPTMSGFRFINISNIVRLEAYGSYTKVMLDNGDVLTATRVLREYEELLPESLFYRIHNSHIINLQKIQQYHKGRGGYVIMEDGTSIEVASRRRQEFLQKLLI